MSRQVTVVAHTHWDREWYSPFEKFQARLVDVMDGLLSLLEADAAFAHFLLDGQVALVDDYLAVRPAAAETVRKLYGEGRLSIGPWYVLMDEFCVSGETIVRNLQLGIQRSTELGGEGGAPSQVGYLPDMFGHVCQMPQLLRLAGMQHAVVWRGVPRSVDRTGFWWSAPDGSTVRAEYLPVGYANGAFLPKDPAELVRRLEAHEVEIGALLGGEETPILLMNGGDHQEPQAWMPELLDAANRAQDRFRFGQSRLDSYLSSATTDGLPAWRGELRSGARSNILMGVLSNRVDLKIAAANAERTIEKLAEPLAVLWLPADHWPGALLDAAWLDMIRNSAHDSICGCSADEVCRAVLHRYDGAAARGDEVIRRSLEIAAIATSFEGPVVVNPSPGARSGIVEVTLAGTDAPPGGQVLDSMPAAVEERTATGADLGRVLAELARDGWLGPSGKAQDARVEAAPAGVVVTIAADASARAEPSMASVMAEAWALAGARPDGPLTVRVERSATQRVAARISDVPGYGWRAWRPSTLDVDPVASGDRSLSNGRVSVEVDAGRGTFALNGLAGFDRLVDSGDDGDTYNYSPSDADIVVDEPEHVSIDTVEHGPVRGVLRVRRRFLWPARSEAGRRTGLEEVEVTTDLELRAGEEFVRIATSFDNRCRDHRLRTSLPLPERADVTVSECAFATVTPAEPEGGPHEFALAVSPSRRFFMAGGLTVTHEGLLEHELAADGRSVAVTLLRATGVLSRPAPRYRPNAAGPALEVPDAQLLGPRRFRYAVSTAALDPWRLAEAAWTPLVVVPGSGDGHLPDAGSRLRVEGAEVSALCRRGGSVELRVFNPSPEPTVARLPQHGGWIVDLQGRRVRRWEQEFTLGPWEIATARLDRTSLD
jgi:mannosylglycerate hydrolase